MNASAACFVAFCGLSLMIFSAIKFPDNTSSSAMNNFLTSITPSNLSVSFTSQKYMTTSIDRASSGNFLRARCTLISGGRLMNLLGREIRNIDVTLFQDFSDLRDLGRFQQSEDRLFLVGSEKRKDVSRLAGDHLAAQLRLLSNFSTMSARSAGWISENSSFRTLNLTFPRRAPNCGERG